MKELSLIYRQIVQRLSEEKISFKSFGLFQKGLYLFLLCYVIHLLPIKNLFLGEQSLILPITSNSFNLFNFSQSNTYHWVLIITFLVSLLKGIFYYPKLIERLIIYFLAYSFFTQTYLFNNGAQQLIIQLLFYAIFVDLKTRNQTTILVSNLGIIACKLQIGIVYFFSGFYKLFGDYWLSGEGVFYSLKINDYIPMWLNLSDNNLFFTFLNYIAMAYLLLFPLFIIFGIRKILWVGIIMHLSIAFIMGIHDFGLIMLISYLLFLPDNSFRLKLSRNFTKEKG